MRSRYGGHSTEADNQIMRTINHEIFHFAQTVASGYMYRRQHRMFEILKATRPPEALPIPDYGNKPTELQQRAINVVTLVSEMDRLSALRQQAAPRDNTLAGAVNPQLFEHLRELDENEAKINGSSLSISALIEGSAAIHAEKLLRISNSNADILVMSNLENWPPEYKTLYELTADRFGNDALELILPATALALRYSNPHEAYFDLAGRLHNRRDVDAVTAGRNLLDAGLPRIERASPCLGDANDQHKPTRQFSVYGKMLRDLARGKWGADAYSLLADPRTMLAMKKWPVAVVMNDGGWAGDVPRDVFAARLVIMSIFLKTRSLMREERNFGKAFIEWLPTLLRDRSNPD